MDKPAAKGFFFELTPDRVLASVESTGLECTGRCFTLNSFENRVYDVELESPEKPNQRVIVKFYRPGRWTREQILEEHEFLNDLVQAEIPAIAPLPFPNRETLAVIPEIGIYYAIFPRVGGRAPDELSEDQLVRIGRLLGRIHNVGAAKKTEHRVQLNANNYGRLNLEFLLKGNWIPLDLQKRYETAVTKICDIADPLLSSVSNQRVHGDCHLGNLLWNNSGPFFLDFDDMVSAPPVQDVWLIVPGRDADALRQREVLLSGYSEMRSFASGSLSLIEPLRALRIIHYSTWIAKRWDDPAFPAAFPQFGSHQYWADEIQVLEGILQGLF